MEPSTPLASLVHVLSRLAQFDAPGSPGPESYLGAYILEVLGTLLLVGILGAIVVAVASDFVEEGAAYVRDDPVMAFVYGLIGYVVSFVLLFLLIITIIGILFAIPGIILLAIIGFVGNVVAVVALGGVLTSGPGEAEDRWTAFLAGLVVWALVGSIPVVGELFTFVVGAMGFGYVIAYWLDSRSETDRRLGDVRRRRGGSGPGTGPGGRSSANADAWRGGPDDDDSPPSGAGTTGEESTAGDDESDRFRNLAALDAEEKERREQEQREKERREQEHHEGEDGEQEESVTDEDESRR